MLNIVIPMVGGSNRYAESYYETPKPLTDIFGHEVYKLGIAVCRNASLLDEVHLAVYLICIIGPVRHISTVGILHRDSLKLVALSRSSDNGNLCTLCSLSNLSFTSLNYERTILSSSLRDSELLRSYSYVQSNCPAWVADLFRQLVTPNCYNVTCSVVVTSN